MCSTSDSITRIQISGFKSIKEADIQLKDINVLIGNNSSGKSCFLAVFELLQAVLSDQLPIYTARSGLNALLFNGKAVTDKIHLEVYFGNNSYGLDLVPSSENGLIVQREYLKEGSKLVGIDTERRTKSALKHGDSKYCNNPVVPILLKPNYRIYHFNDTGRRAKVKQEHNILNDLYLFGDAGNLAAFLYLLKLKYKKHYNIILKTVQLIFPYIDDFVLEPQELNKELILLRWKQVGCDDILYASQLSDGTLRFICLCVLLLQPKELLPQTIIIDEPELGLHPFAITILAEMIKEVSIDKQIIISTQSSDLLDEFDIDDVLVVDRDTNGSKFKRLDDKELEPWLDGNYSLSDLWGKNIFGGRLSSF